MERRRLQQQRMKQQQRFCVSQQDLTEAIARMKPSRRATYNNILNISTSSSSALSSSIDTLTTPSVSQLVKEFEARSTSTPFITIQDVIPSNQEIEVDGSHILPVQTINIKVDNDEDNNISHHNDDSEQTLRENIHQDQFIEDKEQVIAKQDQTLDIDHHKRELQSLSGYSVDDNTNSNASIQMVTHNIENDLTILKRHEKIFEEILSKEAQLNNALADLISLSNDADISSSVSSPSRSLTNISQRPRTSSINDINNNNSISASIALLNNLLETFDLDNEDYKNKTIKKPTNDQISSKRNHDKIQPINMLCLITSDNVCANCGQSFATNEQIVNAAGKVWHAECFVCAQCFQPFENGIYFEYDDRKYCERDFQMLFAPCCAECKKVILGRIIRALQKCFHPECFRCQLCHIQLLDIGFSRNNGRVLCRECHIKETSINGSQRICSTCHQMMDNKYLKYKSEYYHPYHFQCSSCRVELDENAREICGLLYCLPCHNKIDYPICAACRRLIDSRVVRALGKLWHVEHFCCARCAQPFYGSKHYENNGLAYCEMDYHILFGSTCFICNRITAGGTYIVCNKKYCVDHFACSKCETKMNEKTKFYDVDATPVCKACYRNLPSDTRKSLQQHHKKKLLSSIFKKSTV